MTENYLNKIRTNNTNLDSDIPEAQLIQSNPGLNSCLTILLQVKGNIANAKLKSLADLDDQYREELLQAEANYAMMLALSR